MAYRVGDKVIHCMYGLGEVIGLDEKKLSGQSRRYYVVAFSDLTMWVPSGWAGEQNLRLPTSSGEFPALLNILREPGEPLPDGRYHRLNLLSEKMHKRTLDEICRVIRDLTSRARTQGLNMNDAETLRRAQECLLDEWELSLGTGREAARRELEGLLRENRVMKGTVHERL